MTAHDTTSPSAWVQRFAALIRPQGPVLDVACGTGRHVRLCLEHGHSVTGVDRYVAGVTDLLGKPGFEFVDANLEDGRPWPLPGRTFDAVIVTNYLHRPLFPSLAAALAPDGVLIYETFAVGNERYGRPSNPDFLLRPGELLEAFGATLQVVAYEHGIVERPTPAVVQHVCAVNKSDGPVTLPPG